MAGDAGPERRRMGAGTGAEGRTAAEAGTVAGAGLGGVPVVGGVLAGGIDRSWEPSPMSGGGASSEERTQASPLQARPCGARHIWVQARPSHHHWPSADHWGSGGPDGEDSTLLDMGFRLGCAIAIVFGSQHPLGKRTFDPRLGARDQSAFRSETSGGTGPGLACSQ
jgi:hypothetical protein